MLTGRFNLRRTMTGRIVLQVEEEVEPRFAFFGKKARHRRWRDATLMDLAMPEMRALIDLRYKPQFMPQSHYPVPPAPAATLVEEARDQIGESRQPVPLSDGRLYGTAH